MGAKIYVLLATVAALMAMPAVAQAAELIGVEEEIENGTMASLESTNLSAKIVGGEGTLKCSTSKLEGEVAANQSESVELPVTGGAFTGCTAFGFTTDVSTNAGEKPWTLTVQEPEASGEFTVRLEPTSGSSIQLNAQVQFLGVSILTCDYAAEGVDLKGEEGSNVLQVTGSEQFVTQSGGEACGEGATLEGEAELESAGEWMTVVGPALVKLCVEKMKKCTSYEKGTVLEATLKEKTAVLDDVEIECKKSSLTAETSVDSGPLITGELSALAFEECSDSGGACSVKADKLPYPLNIFHVDEVGNGTFFTVINPLETKCGTKKDCKYRGLAPLRLVGGEPATLYAENIILVRIAGDAGECKGVRWRGTYTVTVPDELYVIDENG